MNNSQQPKPKTWSRLIIVVGTIGAVITYVALIWSILSWHINAASARLYERAVSPMVCVSAVTTLFCGVILLKSRPKAGWILMGLVLLALVSGLLFPEL